MVKSPGLTTVPPMAARIFALASTSRELRCQCPMVTPTSFGGAACAKADATMRFDTRRLDASHRAEISLVTAASLLEFAGLTGETRG
jgi:hypothetical protein